MKKILHTVGLIVFIVSSNAFGAEISLLCTGEEFYPTLGIKSPYSFRASINTKSKKFIIDLEKNADAKKATYPKDNPWHKTNCPVPMWVIDITETEIRIITGCSESNYADFGGMLWEIKRTDGEFNFYSHGEERAKGKCVKASERAF